MMYVKGDFVKWVSPKTRPGVATLHALYRDSETYREDCAKAAEEYQRTERADVHAAARAIAHMKNGSAIPLDYSCNWANEKFGRSLAAPLAICNLPE